MKRITTLLIPHLPFLVIFVLMFYIDQFVYMYGDDYRYATYFSIFPHIKEQSFTLAHVIQSQLYDYMHINGRLFLNIFSVFMLVNGIELWRIVNPFVITFLAYLIFYVVYVRLPRKGDGLATTLIAALFFLVHLYIARQTFYYAIGSFNYVYPIVGMYLLIVYFRHHDIGKPIRNKYALILFFLIAFLTGWSQEQISILAVGFLLTWLGKEWIEKRTIKKIHIALFLTTVAGFLGLFLAPGPKVRAMSTALTSYNDLSLFGKLKITFPAVVEFFIHQQAIFTILVTILLSIVCYQKSSKWYWLLSGPIVLLPFIFEVPLFGQEKFVDKLLEHRLYLSLYGVLLMLLIGTMAMYLAIRARNYLLLMLPLGFLLIDVATAFTPSIAGGRVAFPGLALAMSAILLLFNRLKGLGLKYQLVLILTFCALFNYYYVVKNYKANAKIHEARIRIVEHNRQLHQGELQLPRLVNRNPAGYELDEHDWVIKGFHDYYHLDKGVTITVK